MKKIIVIVGPTGVGKTKLSIELAKKYSGEIINADSTQVYRELNIATAKITEEEKENIKHHLFDIKDIQDFYSVFDYQQDCRKKIEEILNKNKTPILVGGTGLYINSLIYGIEFREEKIDEEYRNELNKIAENGRLDELYNKALEIDPEAMKKISKNDKKRIIRILEIYKKTGKKEGF